METPRRGKIPLKWKGITKTLTALIFLSSIICTIGAQVELLSNRGFESGATSSWSRNGDSGIFQGSYPYSGTWYGYLGNSNNAIGSIHQLINIPANVTSAVLTFRLNLVTFEHDASVVDDKMDVNFRHATTDALLKKWITYTEADKGVNTAGTYVLKTINISATDLAPYKGQTVLLQFYGTTDYADSTIFRIDEVSFLATTDDTPAPPTFLETVGYNDHIDLGWADNSTNETGFKIERKVNNGNFSQLTTVSANVYLYTDNAVSGCNIYTYRVRAYSGVINSAYSDEGTNFLRPAAPSNLLATGTTNSISLSWTDNACNEDGLRLERKAGLNGNWARLGTELPINTVGMIDSSAIPGVIYYYRISAYNYSGSSAYSSIASASRTQIYTINASSGSNGTLTPRGDISVNAGNNLDLTATPATNYVVDKWSVDGTASQTGGNNYTLSAIEGNHTILVTFAVKKYSLTLLKLNGDVTISPLLPQYPHGGEITLTATPNSNYRLYDWRGDVSGVGNTLSFKITQNTTIQAYFQLISSPISMQVANSTPATGFQINVPVASEMLHLIQCSDNLFAWCNMSALDGNSPNNVSISPANSGKNNEFIRCLDVQKITTPPFLVFPATNKTTGHKWTSQNTPVASIFDHHGGRYERDGVISTYRGEMVQINAINGFRSSLSGNYAVSPNPGTNYFKNFSIVGYKRDPAHKLSLVFSYPDPNDILWYDGHPGYDYAIGTSEDVVAAAEGNVIPADSDNCYNAICIDHGNGYRSYYLHLSSRSTTIEVGGVVQSVHVNAGDIIGKPGNTTCGSSIGVHLHFELKRNLDNTWISVDPYGNNCLNGDIIEPSLWINGN